MTSPANLVWRIFFKGGESVCFHTFVMDLISGSKWCIQVQSPVIAVFRKFGSFWNICFQSQQWWILLYICSLVWWYGNYLKRNRYQNTKYRRFSNVSWCSSLIRCHSPIFLKDCLNYIDILIIRNIFFSARIRNQFYRQSSFFEISMLFKNRTLAKAFVFVGLFC